MDHNYPPKISLAAARVNAGMLQEVAAAKLHINVATLRSWERGDTAPNYDRFMALCKSGQIHNCCLPNALMTLQEYLMDYASEETAKIGEALIRRQLQDIPRDKTRQIVEQRLQQIRQVPSESQ